MKWALFEFEDLSCEVGESAWILGEDENLFNNDQWFTSNEVIVKWPKDCSWLRKTWSKESPCIDDVETERYPAKIVKFSDSFEIINEYLKTYVKTGSTKTPVRGRGHRVSKKNRLFEDKSDDEDKENHSEKPQVKKRKKEKSNDDEKNAMFEVIRKKYGNSDIPTVDGLTSELPSSKKERHGLMNGLKNEIQILKGANTELKDQVEQLHLALNNLKDLPSIIRDLRETVDDLKTASFSKLQSSTSFAAERPQSSPLASKLSPATPSRISPATSRISPAMKSIQLPPVIASCSTNLNSPCSAAVNEEMSGDDSTKVEIHPGIHILPSQKKILDVMGDVKSFIYSIMEMVWSRGVLATHSMTGKVSNAHKGKMAKPSLDQGKVTALCELAMKRFRLSTEKEIRTHMKSKLNNIEKCHKLKK